MHYPEIKRYIDPTTDYGFKRLFSDKPVLLSFLNAVLPEKDRVADVTYVNQEMLGDNPEGRVVIFDLHCTTADDRTVIVEMQRLPQPYFKRRILYYAMRGFEHHMRRGVSEFDLPPVYVIGILDFDLPGNYKGYAHRFLLKSDAGELFSDVLQLYFVELSKFDMTDTPTHDLTALEQWTAALKEMPAMESIPDWVTDEDIKRAFDLSEVANLSPAERSKFERAVREDADFRGQVLQQYIYGKMKGLNEGREEGRQEGRQEGLEQGRHDIIRQLADSGKSVEEIASWLNMSKATVEKLLR